MLRRIILLIAILALAAGCQQPVTPVSTSPNLNPTIATQAEQAASPTQAGGSMILQITSPAFADSQLIPKKYTCDELNVSPQLDWAGVPSGTQSLALIADDPDAPVGTWVHWVLYNIPATTTGLPEGVKGIGVRGTNSFPSLDYGGPCPPKGPAHRYFFKLYALDLILNLTEGAKKADVEKAMKGHILSQGQLVGKYGR